MFKRIFSVFFILKIWKSSFLDHSDDLYITTDKSLIDEISDKFVYVADPFAINNTVYFEGLSLSFSKGQLFSLANKQLIKIIFSAEYRDNHMSFPFVFSYDKSNFLLPQISGINKLVLFKLDRNTATKYKTLLYNNEYRDSVIFEYNDNFILFTTERAKTAVDFKAFRFDQKFNFVTEIVLHNHKKDFRCAGNVFMIDNELIIPVQNSEPIYGSGVNLYKFDVTNDNITFTFHKEIKISSSSDEITGFHTYNMLDEKNVLIDYRVEKFNLFAIFYKLKFYFDQKF